MFLDGVARDKMRECGREVTFPFLICCVRLQCWCHGCCDNNSQASDRSSTCVDEVYAKDMAEDDDPALTGVQSEVDSHPLDISAVHPAVN